MIIKLDDGTTWTFPDPELAWKLTYSNDLGKRDRLQAASALGSFEYLLFGVSAKRRAEVIRQLKPLIEARWDEMERDDE